MNQETGQSKFCGSCGVKTESSAAFCPACGVGLAGVSSPPSKVNTDDKKGGLLATKGRLLATASGEGIPGYGTDWAVAIGIAVFLIILGFILANIFGYTTTWGFIEQRNMLYYFFVISGFIEAGVVIFVIWLRNSLIKKTNVSVYENGVVGSGLDPKFATDFFSPEKYAISSFSLTYEQVTSVSVMGDKGMALVISATGKEFLIASAVAKEMEKIINNKLAEGNLSP
jgi:hypothetical protein